MTSMKKVTSAVKTISQAKMPAVMQRLLGGRDYGIANLEMVFQSDEFLKRKMPGEVGEVATVVVPVTSDKGMCGAINSSIVRLVKKMIESGDRSKYTIFGVGGRGAMGLARPLPDCLK